MSVEIRRMTVDDVSGLAELEKICFSHPWTESQIAEECDNPNAVFFTAFFDDDIAGYGGMLCAAGECYIANIAVFPEHRKKGVGKAIINSLINAAADMGGEFITLEVRQSNIPAISLYEKAGFTTAGVRKNFYTDPLEDGVIMTKILVEDF